MGARSIFFWVAAILMGVQPLYAKVEPASKFAVAKVRVPLGTACSGLKLGQMCKTSKNKCFKMVNDDAFGIGMQEMGDDCKHKGTIWARQLQQIDINYDLAQKKCPKGTRPPTQEEFTRLRSSVATEKGKNDNDHNKKYNKELLSESGKSELYALLPDMKGHWFWSSSPINDDVAFDFFGDNGSVGYYNRNVDIETVRCVR